MPAAEANERVRESSVVYLPEPIDDGGTLAARCARFGAILLSPRTYGPGKEAYPYTAFDPTHRKGHRRLLLLWVCTSQEYGTFFREDAARRAVHFQDDNRRVQFVQKVAYRFPEYGNARSLATGTSLLDQIRHRSGPRETPYGKEECIAVCLVRNGGEHLPSFLAHYRALGVKHFVFVDNGSEDGTLAMLDAQTDVTVYETALPHKYYECEMRRLIIEQHCRNQWCLNVDVDELFDYPRSSDVALTDLLRYLRRTGATAMAGYLLDMFAKENAFGTSAALDLKAAYPYYDIDDVSKHDYFTQAMRTYCDHNTLLANDLPCYFGGIRQAVFGSSPNDQYLLTKHPLIFLDGRLAPVTHPHYSNQATVADVTCVLYHYKFTPSFKDKVRESITSRRYLKFSQHQYQRYDRRIGATSSITIDTAGTRRLRGVQELVERGLLATSRSYERFADNGRSVAHACSQVLEDLS